MSERKKSDSEKWDDAVNELKLAIFKALKIPQIVDWLSKLLQRVGH